MSRFAVFKLNEVVAISKLEPLNDRKFVLSPTLKVLLVSWAKTVVPSFRNKPPSVTKMCSFELSPAKNPKVSVLRLD